MVTFKILNLIKAMDDIYTQSLNLHKKYKGKIELVSKVPVTNKEELALVYTPGVAEVSRAIGRDKMLAYEYTAKGNMVAIVSDGSAILGLGNLGAHAAIPVMEGKAVLFKKLAGIDAFPICVNTQNTEDIISLVKNIAPMFGAINLEDISAPRCFEIEKRLRNELDIPVMHDDQQGTAVVVLAGLINALKVRGGTKETVRVVLSGAGAAGTAVAKLLILYGFKNLIVSDSHGAIYQGRGNMNSDKEKLAQITNYNNRKGILTEILMDSDIFIGLSMGNILTSDMVRSMAKDPIIFAMANPVPEIMPDVAKAAGAFIIATGRSDFPNQINNSLAFPGIFRGALDNHIKQFTEKMFLDSAEGLAGYVKNPTAEQLLPLPLDMGVALVIKSAIKQ